MRCNKSKFRSRRAAKTKINILLRAGRWNKKSKYSREYYCESCKAWHITSMNEFDPSIKPVSMTLTYKEKWQNLLQY